MGILFEFELLFYTHDIMKEVNSLKLGELALVRSGLVLSRKQSREPSSFRYPLLNLRSIAVDGNIELGDMDVFDASEMLKSEYISQAGDVIVRLTAPYTAILVDKDTAGMVISSNFIIIRTDSKKILPEYLYWLLNTSEVKRKIAENTSSNMLGAVKASYFNEFEISLLPIDGQQKIAALNLLSRHESRLLMQLAQEKAKYNAHQIERAQKQMRRGN